MHFIFLGLFEFFEASMEVVASVTSIIGLCCSLHEVVRTKYKHLRTPTRSIRQLNNLMHRLIARARGVEHEINQLQHLMGAESTNFCNTWLKQVDQVEREVCNLVDENGPHRQIKGCCFICSRIKLGELVEEKIQDIRELLETVPDSKDIAIPVSRRGDILPTTPMMENQTHKLTFMRIWEFLFDRNARRIGVWGMGGVGKTTIMLAINNSLLNNSSEFNCYLGGSVK